MDCLSALTLPVLLYNFPCIRPCCRDRSLPEGESYYHIILKFLLLSLQYPSKRTPVLFFWKIIEGIRKGYPQNHSPTNTIQCTVLHIPQSVYLRCLCSTLVSMWLKHCPTEGGLHEASDTQTHNSHKAFPTLTQQKRDNGKRWHED